MSAPEKPSPERDARVRQNLARGLQAAPGAFVAPGAHLTGRIVLGEKASVWYGAVVRGDIEPVFIGEGSNVQDAAVLHTADDLPCRVGNWVTIGHSAVIHACTIGDECLIGMGAIILDGAVIGPRCIIGASALVTQNTKIPEGSLVLGVPARIARPLTAVETASLRNWAERYVPLAALHREHHAGTKRRLPNRGLRVKSAPR